MRIHGHRWLLLCPRTPGVGRRALPGHKTDAALPSTPLSNHNERHGDEYHLFALSLYNQITHNYVYAK